MMGIAFYLPSFYLKGANALVGSVAALRLRSQITVTDQRVRSPTPRHRKPTRELFLSGWLLTKRSDVKNLPTDHATEAIRFTQSKPFEMLRLRFASLAD